MSITASRAADWHIEQKDRITTYKPKKPEMPNNYRCASEECKNHTPNPPGFETESFLSGPAADQYPTDWLVLMAIAVAAFVLVTSRSSP